MAVMAVLYLVGTTINPADRNVRLKNAPGPTGRFDRSKRAHVIEDSYCALCEVKV